MPPKYPALPPGYLVRQKATALGAAARGKVRGVIGAFADITDMKRSQEALQKLADERLVLVQELNHRVKNTLTIVQAMVARTLRDTHDVNEARNLLDGRLIALSKAHGILVMNSWEGGSLRELIDRAIPEFWAHRIASEGPDLKVHANHLVKLSMAFFELTTNAVKYGALSNNAGRVEIRWLAANPTIRKISSLTGSNAAVRPLRHRSEGVSGFKFLNRCCLTTSKQAS